MQPFTLQDALVKVHALLSVHVEQDPGISGQDLVGFLAEMIAAAENSTDRAVCRCGKQIILPLGFADWVHDTKARERGCRAASFHNSDGWDDSISTSWKAVPAKSR